MECPAQERQGDRLDSLFLVCSQDALLSLRLIILFPTCLYSVCVWVCGSGGTCAYAHSLNPCFLQCVCENVCFFHPNPCATNIHYSSVKILVMPIINHLFEYIALFMGPRNFVTCLVCLQDSRLLYYLIRLLDHLIREIEFVANHMQYHSMVVSSSSFGCGTVTVTYIWPASRLL